MDEQKDTYDATQTDDSTVSETARKYKSTPVCDGTRRYTYSDYITWDDDTRWELIDGIPYAMSAPARIHQEILGELFVQLHSFLKNKPCKVYVAPFDIRLNYDTTDDTVVQPDILVVCEADIRSKATLTDAGCDGAPDLAVEILSPSTSRHDRIVKLQQYEKYGVREYWIVDPEINGLTVYLLENGRYFVRTYSDSDSVPVSVVTDCVIDLSEVFPKQDA